MYAFVWYIKDTNAIQKCTRNRKLHARVGPFIEHLFSLIHSLFYINFPLIFAFVFTNKMQFYLSYSVMLTKTHLSLTF